MPFTPPTFAEGLSSVLAEALPAGPDSEEKRARLLASIDNLFLNVHLALVDSDVTADYEARVLDTATRWLNEMTEQLRRGTEPSA